MKILADCAMTLKDGRRWRWLGNVAKRGEHGAERRTVQPMTVDPVSPQHKEPHAEGGPRDSGVTRWSCSEDIDEIAEDQKTDERSIGKRPNPVARVGGA